MKFQITILLVALLGSAHCQFGFRGGFGFGGGANGGANGGVNGGANGGVNGGANGGQQIPSFGQLAGNLADQVQGFGSRAHNAFNNAANRAGSYGPQAQSLGLDHILENLMGALRGLGAALQSDSDRLSRKIDQQSGGNSQFSHEANQLKAGLSQVSQGLKQILDGQVSLDTQSMDHLGKQLTDLGEVFGNALTTLGREFPLSGPNGILQSTIQAAKNIMPAAMEDLKSMSPMKVLQAALGGSGQSNPLSNILGSLGANLGLGGAGAGAGAGVGAGAGAGAGTGAGAGASLGLGGVGAGLGLGGSGGRGLFGMSF